jgi:hypothetical protein
MKQSSEDAGLLPYVRNDGREYDNNNNRPVDGREYDNDNHRPVIARYEAIQVGGVCGRFSSGLLHFVRNDGREYDDDNNRPCDGREYDNDNHRSVIARYEAIQYGGVYRRFSSGLLHFVRNDEREYNDDTNRPVDGGEYDDDTNRPVIARHEAIQVGGVYRGFLLDCFGRSSLAMTKMVITKH